MSEHMNLDEYKKLTGQVSVKTETKNKYGNKITYLDGIRFDSKAEARRYQELKLLQQAGEIQGFGRQPSFILGLGARYMPDFIVCGKDGTIWVEDVKGFETAVFAFKRNLWKEKYPWIELKVFK